MTHQNPDLIKTKIIKTTANKYQFEAWKKFRSRLDVEPQEWIRNVIMELVYAGNAAHDAKENGRIGESNVHRFPARRASDAAIKYALAH